MKIYKIPEKIEAFIFDIDSTLYTNPEYAYEQVDCQIREFADELGFEVEEARFLITEFQREYEEEHNGQKISLGNTLVRFGVPIKKSVKWRKKLLKPKEYLKFDGRLVYVISRLREKAKVICVTNNPVLPAKKTLKAIGLDCLIPKLVGLDTCYKSKPAPEPFLRAVKRLGVSAECCLAIGDRYDMDIAMPLELGMGGILVNGVRDVYDIYKVCYNQES